MNRYTKEVTKLEGQLAAARAKLESPEPDEVIKAAQQITALELALSHLKQREREAEVDELRKPLQDAQRALDAHIPTVAASADRLVDLDKALTLAVVAYHAAPTSRDMLEKWLTAYAALERARFDYALLRLREVDLRGLRDTAQGRLDAALSDVARNAQDR